MLIVSRNLTPRLSRIWSRAFKRAWSVLGIGTTIAGLLAAYPAVSGPNMFCDQITVEYYNKFLHIRSPANNLANEEANARQISCSTVYPLSSDLDLVVGWGAMAFLNSFNTQAFSLGVNFEAQYRPAFLGDFGAFAGLDAGFIYGYKGSLPNQSLVGPWRAGAISKFGVLWDVPETNLTVFAGARYVPPRGGAGGGIFAPGIGLTYHFN